ncbi:MAG TPA: STAS domain-containing protein [Actinocrinis sp.]|nr:STAS domain-containing protein [Actinocrinis sp.]
MDRQEQKPGIGQDPAEAVDAVQIVGHLEYESTTATARLNGRFELLEPVIAHKTGQPHNQPCVVQPRGTDLVLTGEIDLHNADEIESRIVPWLHAAENYLDCTGVHFMDSMGLTMMLRVRAKAVQRGAHLRVTCSATVYHVLAMAGLTDALHGLTVTRAENA